MVDELNDVVASLKNNLKIKTVSFESAEKGHFCTGANLKERIGMKEKDIEKFVTNLRATFQRIYSMD